ncbi:hypothetical protein [Mangrovicella endophytica]|uniref:hypothetical protein n=1 Tax=Mangrovicella endophytica TaxID=2066697 RepID=UPI0012FFFE0C|nr:hypothetical protein [Mangrovicella endophytica]
MNRVRTSLLAVLGVITLAGPAAAEYRHWDDGSWNAGRPERVDGRFLVQDGFGRGYHDRRPWRRYDDDMLSERQVVRRLMREGFVSVDDIERRRDRYIVRAVRRNGALMRLAIDAYDGNVIARERIGWRSGYGRRGYDDYHHHRPGFGFSIGID